jgi:hypothetical protein
MQTSTASQCFRHGHAAIIHQNGSQLTQRTEGVEVILHTRENEKQPSCAEVISGNHYAEIGLSFEGNELSDYDCVFYLPREIGEMLTDAGYIVPEDCFT